jgi:hypothetical protein
MALTLANLQAMGIDPRRSHEWRSIPARAVDRWYVGLDIGQSIDPSAVCALNHVIVPLDSWQPNAKAETWKQDRTERFLVRHLERLPLGMAYPQQVEHVRYLLSRDPLKGAQFALDYTGVGRPCADLFYRAGLRPMNILITAGSETTYGDGAHHVPKQTLISQLETRLHTGELRIAADLVDAPALRDELRDFARKVSESGRVTFNARSGAHDDLVLAVAIALFAALNRPWSSCEELRI